MDKMSIKIYAMKKDLFWSYYRWIVVGIFLPLTPRKITTWQWSDRVSLLKFITVKIRF